MKIQAAPTDAADGKPLARTAAITALSNIALPLTSLISGPILAHALPPDKRGIMTGAVVPAFVLMFLANMGLPEATTFAVAKLRQDPRAVFLRAASISIPLGIISAAFFWAIAPYLYSDSMQAAVPLARHVILFLPALMLVIILRFTVNGMRRYRAVNTERVLTPVLRLLGFVILVVLGTLTAGSAAVSQMCATVLGGCFLFWTLLRHGSRVADREPTEKHLTRTLASFGARGWGAVLGNLVNWRLDQLVLLALISDTQLGLYVVAVHFSEIPSTAVNAVRNVIFAEAAHRNEGDLVARAARSVVLLVGVSSIVAGCLSPLLIRFLFGVKYMPALGMALVLLVATLPFCLEQILAAGLFAMKLPGLRSISQLLAAIVTVVGLFTLCPHIGAMGAAITSLVAYTVNAGLAVYQFTRKTGMSVRDVTLPRGSDVRWVSNRLMGLIRSMTRKVRRRPTPSVPDLAPDDDPTNPIEHPTMMPEDYES